MIRLFAFERIGERRLGIEIDGAWHDISHAAIERFGTVALETIAQADRLTELTIAAAELARQPMPRVFNWLPPLVRPGKIVAMVQNYRKHAAEFGNVAPPEPVWFGKLSSSLAGNNQPIVIPSWVDGRVDHEVELGVVIGKRAKEVSEAEAISHVAGYTVINDVSARRIQKEDREKTHPWLRCKNFDTFTPMGPYFVPARFVPDPQNLRIACRVNGETRQDANTSDMIHPVAKQIAVMSRWMTLEPGDVIATGTPEGVNNLRDGDECECEIESIGILRNPVSRKPAN